MSNSKVLWLMNVPSPYRMQFFEILSEHCDLFVVFEKNKSDERDKSWGKLLQNKSKNYVVLRGIKTDTDKALSFQVIGYLKKAIAERRTIIISSIFTPTGILAVMYLRLHGYAYWLESDGGFYHTEESIFKNRIKRMVYKGAFRYLTTCENDVSEYINHGGSTERVRKYILSSVQNKQVTKVDKNQQNKLKSELNIDCGKTTLLFVGQIIYRKGIDILIKAIKELDSSKYECHIIGGSVDDYIKNFGNESIPENIYFHKHISSKNELEKYYLASDILVFPTREDIWGLVTLEALARNLVVITTDKCNSGIEVINDCGVIIPSDNVKSLVNAIDSLDNEKRQIFKQREEEKALSCTIEAMVGTHLQILEVKDD